jgi:hypothetical protein
MTRTGKIARLPREIRDELNRRLQDGQPGTELVTWLNSLQPVQAVLEMQFNSQPINAQNLSDWNDGGYRDWLLQQETVDLVHLMQDNSDELTQSSTNTGLSDLLAHRLVARIVLLAQRLDQSAAEGPPDPRLLTELCADVVALRKGDHSAQRLKLARDRLDFEHESDTRDLEELGRKWAEAHHYQPAPELTPLEQAERMWKIFGCEGEYEEWQAWRRSRAASAQPRHMRQRQGQDPAAASSATIEQPESSRPPESQNDPTESVP